MSEELKLPPLPEPDHSLDHGTLPFFTADQMHDYALTAIAARPVADAGEAVKGWQVSLDVSTGESDALHRVFGTVEGWQDSAAGPVLLATETSRNFDSAAPSARVLSDEQAWELLSKHFGTVQRVGVDAPHIEIYTKRCAGEAVQLILAATSAPGNLSAPQDSKEAGEEDCWQPMTTAPKDGTKVLLWLGAPWSEIRLARWYAAWKNWQEGEFPDIESDEYCGIGSNVPTHWMPLPAAPTTKEG